MTLPTDTIHFDPLVGGAADNAATFNLVLSQLSGAISALATLLDTAQTVTYGTALAARDAVYLNPADGKVYKLDADDPTAASCIRGFVETVGAADATGSFLISGILEGFTGLTPFARVYADSAVPGALTHTRPTATLDGTQMAVIDMGYAISATQIVIAPQAITYFKRANLADEETLTIQHIADTLDYTRKIRAHALVTIPGATIAEYTSGNQDSDVALRDQAPATYGTDQCTGGTASASGVSVGAAADGFDDSVATFWGTAWSNPQWLQYTITANKTIRQYTVQAYNAGTGVTSAPQDWTLQYWGVFNKRATRGNSYDKE